jgi:drug/metabolite transporter superfamily protein YnfA
MSIPTLAIIIALVLAIIEEVQAAGRNYLAWGIIVCLAIALLWGKLG